MAEGESQVIGNLSAGCVRRVRHWQSGTMVLRRTAAGVLEEERGFRKLAGYRAMTALVCRARLPRC